MLLRNLESQDVSNLLDEALRNLGYPSARIHHYVFLVEEALRVWREELSSESELCFTRTDRGNDVFFEWSIKERRLDPFSKEAVTDYDKPIRTMIDRLLSGIGTELRYSYRKGTNRITLRLPKTNARDTLFKRTAMASILPFSIQYLIINLAANMGVLVLGFLSSQAMAGASFACQILAFHTLFIDVAVGAVNSIISQFWGKRNGSAALYAMRTAAVFSAILCVAEFFICFFFPRQCIGIYTDFPELIEEGAVYLKVVSPSFLFNSFCCTFYAFLRITGHEYTALKILLAGCILNFLLNLLLVFGLFGLPALGTAGAAVGMAVGICLQFLLCVITYRKIRPSFVSPDDEVNRPLIRKVFFKNALPIFLQYGAYMIGVTFIAAAVGRLDADVIAAYAFVNAVNVQLMCTLNATGDTSAILSGLQLGRNHFEDAVYEHRLYCRLTTRIALFVGAALLTCILLSSFLPLKLSSEARRYLVPIALFFAVNDLFGLQNYANSGALYAGGEARIITLIDAAVYLLILVPLSLLSIRLELFAPLMLIFLCKTDEALTYLPKVLAVRKGKWLKNIVE